MTSAQISSAWEALESHNDQIVEVHMRDLFANDPNRFARFSAHLDDLLLDYSKNRVTEETLGLLMDLAATTGIEDWRRRMFAGDTINTSEDRAVLHAALRDPSGELTPSEASARAAGEIHRMRTLQTAIRNGGWTNIVHIGIGGSYLGPQMATAALAPYATGPHVHYVSNVDGTHLMELLAVFEPQTTFVIVASKTFTTDETMTNAKTAKAWLTSALGDQAVSQNFAAVTAERTAAEAFGILPGNVFEIWDWIGGRYSATSAIALPLALVIGMERFEDFLAGAHAMDAHFVAAPLQQNLPVILALIGVWNATFLGARSHAILPYGYRLRHLPRFLQQLEMESNGKNVTRNGVAVSGTTAPVIFGELGTDGQHTFYQLLHQGSDLVSCDFIAAAKSDNGLDNYHSKLLANFLAQSEALMLGRAAPTGEPHRNFPGNRPSNSIVVRRVNPRTLGMLVALYEHKVFVQGVIWGINSFDQWGVELGKEMSQRILPELTSVDTASGHDSSTNGLIDHLKRLREEDG